MAFNFQQYRKRSGFNYISLLGTQPSNKRTEDGKIIFDISNLDSNKYYYFKISYNKQHTTNSTIYVRLLKDLEDEINNTQTIGIFHTNIKQSGIINFETTCSPVFNDLNFIIISSNIQINIDDINIEIYEIFNIQSHIGNKQITHFGVQSKPNLLLCINGNPLRVGKSGLMELENTDINFNFIGAIILDSQDNFIFDYEWKE